MHQAMIIVQANRCLFSCSYCCRNIQISLAAFSEIQASLVRMFSVLDACDIQNVCSLCTMHLCM